MSLYKEIAKLKSKLIRPFGIEPPRNEFLEVNGEFALLARLASADEQDCLVDVGAAEGIWTEEARKHFKAKEFICFEPMPWHIEKLRTTFASQNVTIHQCALSDKPGSDTMHSVGVGGRVHIRDNMDGGQKEIRSHTVRFETGDRMLQGRRPYFIKIDCDGHDAKVIRGLEQTLRSARPVIQFEYCDMWILANETLGSTSAFLNGLGYSLYRVWPGRLAPFSFSFLFETFAYQNFVAVPTERDFPRLLS